MMNIDDEPAPPTPTPPEPLMARSVRPGGVDWWPLDAALEAIEWYRQERMAVIGVDLAYVTPGRTQATSEMYGARSESKEADWPAHVERCARAATAFVSRYHAVADAHFDLVAVTREWDEWWWRITGGTGVRTIEVDRRDYRA